MIQKNPICEEVIKEYFENGGTSVSDLNSIVKTLTVIADNTTANVPNNTNLAWVVSTFSASSIQALQIAVGYNPTETYIRRFWGGWEPWKKIATKSDIPTPTALTQTDTDPTITKFDPTISLSFVNGMIQGLLAIRVVTALPANNQYSVGNIGMTLDYNRAFEIVSADSYAVTVMVSTTGQVDIFPRGNVPANELLRATVCIPT